MSMEVSLSVNSFSETMCSSRRFLCFLNNHLQTHLPKTHSIDQENKLQKAELPTVRSSH
jgi:hypothetical protein